MSELTIRPFVPADRAEWEPLWQGYLTYYKAALPDEVTADAWNRLVDPEGELIGLCAVNQAGDMLGIVHYLYHPTPWAIGPRCYLHDLFTVPQARGQGVARALIQAVYDDAFASGAAQVYWLTQDFNETARHLYDKVADLTPFIKYAKSAPQD